MSKNEAKSLEEFKSQIKDYLNPKTFLHQDIYLKKWLVARDYNVNKAVKMFMENVEFRKKYNVDDILTEYEPSEILKKYTTGGLIGYDKDGNVLRVELFGHLDMKGIMYSSKKIDIEKMKILECEKIVEMWKNWNNEHPDSFSDGMTVIFDMEGVTSQFLWRPGLTMYLHLIKLLEDNYPEMLKRLLVINSPSIFPFFWKICRPLVSEHTKKKIFIIQSNYTKELLKYIDADSLPAIYGGSKTDPDGNPKCETLICYGGKVPPEKYSPNMENIKDSVEIHINAGNQHFLQKSVKETGSILRWEFKTSENDLGYGLCFLNQNKEKEYIIPIERVNCHMVPEDGSYLCKKPGEYELVFDNSYSVARGKVVHAFFEVLDPDETFKSEFTVL